MLTFLVAVCLGLFCAIWVHGDAKSRGSSVPLLWAILVFCCLIIFLPLYLIMRPSRPTFVRMQPLLCPYCGKYYEPPVAFCPNCGRQLNKEIE